MAKSHAILLGLLAIMASLSGAIGLDQGLTLSAAQSQGCQCSAKMSCSCCQSVSVSLMLETSTLCLSLSIGAPSGSINLGATLDGTSVGAFSLNPLTPPTYCVPAISLASLDVCLKVNIEVKGAAVKACPTFYTNYSSSQVAGYDFPCVQVGVNGVGLV
ncbi:uncharacterized protein LOC108025015 [Drosophila biarmipes]|uniref:uncharacterized protein LOC108025015 n=1 Tax=Drosophila biarmipes TaxID=125945 RepID=UPI0007E6A3CD|nr:uncharacterized protein LOC108025015 [Drosophila biarmipes]